MLVQSVQNVSKLRPRPEAVCHQAVKRPDHVNCFPSISALPTLKEILQNIHRTSTKPVSIY